MLLSPQTQYYICLDVNNVTVAANIKLASFQLTEAGLTYIGLMIKNYMPNQVG